MIEDAKPGRDLPSVDQEAFRGGLRRLAAGVTLVTSKIAGRRCGLTATSCMSVSLQPPLVLVSIDRWAETATGIQETGAFGISLLPVDHEEVSRRFATARFRAKFDGLRFRRGMTGVPLLENAHACIECLLWDSHVAGDHTLYLGRVVAVTLGERTEPLVYHQGRYAGLSHEVRPDPFARVAQAEQGSLVKLLNTGDSV